MRELSEWQAARVRDALRAYHRYQRGIDGEYFTWKDVREAIAVYTDVEIGTSSKNGAERLRQFVEGIEDGKGTGKRKFPLPQPAAIEGIVAFVTDEELNLLTLEELQEYRPAFQAPLRLLEYLKHNYDVDCSIPQDALEGSYQTQKPDEDNFIIRQLTMQLSSERGLIQVIETEDVYDLEISSSIQSLSPGELKSRRFITQKYGGWAILTPEYNLLLFMKDEQSGSNRYYFTMHTDMTRKLDKPVNRIVLLQHEYPLEENKDSTQTVDEFLKAMTEELANNLYAFERH